MKRIIKFLENELDYTFAYISMVEASMNSGFDFVNDIRYGVEKFNLSNEELKIIENIHNTYHILKTNTELSKNSILKLKNDIFNTIEI